jgi:hypothetical protein
MLANRRHPIDVVNGGENPSSVDPVIDECINRPLTHRQMRSRQVAESTIMRYYIQPVVKRLGIKKRVTWAHLPSHLYDPYSCQRRRREGGAGVVATQLVTHHDGHLRSSADVREAGSIAESGGDGEVGEIPH